jgi:putative redox protein
MKTTTKWVSHSAFDSTSDNNHTVRLDTTVEGGGLNSGMSPKKMLLSALAGCSGMDVVDILNKMKVPFTKMEIEAEAEQTTETPTVFKWIKLIYKSDVKAEQLDKLKRAVELSQEKYCGIAAMLKKHCAIEYSIELM